MFGSKEKIIYGAGFLGMRLAEFLKKSEGENSVYCFIDNYKDGSNVDGIPLLKIDQLKDSSMIVCMTFDDHDNYFISELNKRGFSNIIPVNELISSNYFFEYIRPKRFWDVPDGPDIISRNKAHIDTVRSMLEDEESIALLDRIVRFRSSLRSEDYVERGKGRQYFPDDIPVFSGMDEVRFVDAGAYRGDTLRSLYEVAAERKIKVESCACFEPDSNNFPYLLSEAYQKKGNIFLYPAAVWSKREALLFESILDEPTASYVSDGVADSREGDYIFGVPIDECLYSMRPNFIKMDIEGAELDALGGASNTIKEFRPTLAICLYHKPNDLWEIPIKVNSIYDNYSMYIRLHGHFLYETVLYCVPRAQG